MSLDEKVPDDRACPLCGLKDSRVVYDLEAGDLIKKWREGLGVEVSNYLKGVEKIILLECAKCKLQYYLPSDLEGPGEFYASLCDFDWYKISDKWEYDFGLKKIRSGGDYLEVGCGEGRFIERALQKCDCRFEGVELNERSQLTAVGKGLSVRKVDIILEAKSSTKTYDAVFAFQVLEHISKPAPFLESLCSLVKKGGLLVLGVPNRLSYMKNIKSILDAPPHHATRWCKDTMAAVAEIFPVKLLEVKNEPLTQPQHVKDFAWSYTDKLRKTRLVWRLIDFGFEEKLNAILRNKIARYFFDGPGLCAVYQKL